MPFLLNERYQLGHDYARQNFGLWQYYFLPSLRTGCQGVEILSVQEGKQSPNCGKSLLNPEREAVTPCQVAAQLPFSLNEILPSKFVKFYLVAAKHSPNCEPRREAASKLLPGR